MSKIIWVLSFICLLLSQGPVTASDDPQQNQIQKTNLLSQLPPEVLSEIFHTFNSLDEVKRNRKLCEKFSDPHFYDFPILCKAFNLSSVAPSELQSVIQVLIEKFKILTSKFKGIPVTLSKFIKNENLKALAGIPTIDLSSCFNITDDGLKALAGVHTIDLSSCNKITHKGLQALKGVHSINLLSSDVTDDGLKALAGVHTIDLSLCFNITDDGVKALKGVHKIKLVLTKVTDKGVRALAGVHSIDLSHCIVTNAAKDYLRAQGAEIID